MQYKLTHSTPEFKQIVETGNLDVIRLSLRDYTNARKSGESHQDAYEFVEHRFQRYNATLLNGLSVVEIRD